MCSVHSSNFPNAYFLLSLSFLGKFLSFLLFLTQAPFFQERHAACRYIVVKVLLFSANGVDICRFLNGKNQSVISQISGHFSNLHYFNFQTCLTVPEITTNWQKQHLVTSFFVKISNWIASPFMVECKSFVKYFWLTFWYSLSIGTHSHCKWRTGNIWQWWYIKIRRRRICSGECDGSTKIYGPWYAIYLDKLLKYFEQIWRNLNLLKGFPSIFWKNFVMSLFRTQKSKFLKDYILKKALKNTSDINSFPLPSHEYQDSTLSEAVCSKPDPSKNFLAESSFCVIFNHLY